LEFYNRVTDSRYISIQELIFSPPSFDIEINFRERVLKSHYDISTIIVVDTIPRGRIGIGFKKPCLWWPWRGLLEFGTNF